jgi:nitroimidazol reductase NimA-like FMN-containing flavoprotein (pyridoxamine 5'-phosphate oxidase superfamily)
MDTFLISRAVNRIHYVFRDLNEMNAVKMTRKILQPMSSAEWDQFLTCARVGRVGIALKDGPYIVPVRYAYERGEIFFHSCFRGLKMDGMRENTDVCFEVDESTSDASMYKSVIARSTVEILEDSERGCGPISIG